MSHHYYPANENLSPRGHMAIEEITAYHEGRLDEESRHRAEEHLNACPACAELLAEYAAFEPTTEPNEKAKGSIAADDVLARLRSERWRRFAAIAATFAIVTLGALVWSQRRSSFGSEIPEVDITLGIRGPESEIEFPAKTRTFALRLAGDAIASGERYDIGAQSQNGQVVASMPGLVADAPGVVRVELEAQLLPPGTYRFTIRPEHPRPGQPSTLEFTLRIRHSP